MLAFFSLYAGAGNNDLDSGTLVGSAEVMVEKCDEEGQGSSFVMFLIASGTGDCIQIGAKHVHVYHELPSSLSAPGQYQNRCCQQNELCYVFLHTSIVRHYCRDDDDTNACVFDDA
jgi:hypothetical protein